MQSYPEKGLDTWTLSQQNVALYRDQVSDFSVFAAFRSAGVTMTSESSPERLAAIFVTGDFFSVLGTKPLLGRVFGRAEDRPNIGSVAVLSYGFWQSHFGGRDVSRITLNLEGTPTPVIGVMPPSFAYPRPDAQIYLPLGLDPGRRFGWSLTGVGRLRPGVSADHAAKQATGVMWTWARDNPDVLSATPIDPATTRMHAIVTPLRDAITGSVARPLFVLQAAVLVLLLIAVANIATLISSRSTARAPELAVRTALGATPRRVARQLLTESVALAVLGGLLGVLVATLAVRGFVHWSPRTVPLVESVRVNGSVLAFALVVTIASGLIFGSAPAIRVARTRRLADDLTGSQKQSARASARRLNAALIVAQLALSTVLLLSAGLVAKSFQRLLATDLGFNPRHAIGAMLALPMQKYMDRSEVAPATEAIVDRVRTLPGVRAAAAVWSLPYSGNVNSDGYLIEGHAPPPNAGAETQVVQQPVTPGYFDALGIPIRYGRDVSRDDRPGSLPVVVVDEALASRYWAGGNAIGKRMRFSGDTTWMTIVGVVGSVRDEDVVAEPRPHAYQPYAQAPGTRPSLAIRVAGDPTSVIAALPRAIHELEPGAPVIGIRPLGDFVGQALDNQRLTEVLLIGFALIAAGLAAVGVYGVMALYVANRSREFGIRLAIGARPTNLVALVVRQGLGLASGGLAVGLVAGLVATRSLRSLLYEVSPTDPVVFVGIAAGLFAVATVACVTPARRAARDDPLTSLRAE